MMKGNVLQKKEEEKEIIYKNHGNQVQTSHPWMHLLHVETQKSSTDSPEQVQVEGFILALDLELEGSGVLLGFNLVG